MVVTWQIVAYCVVKPHLNAWLFQAQIGSVLGIADPVSTSRYITSLLAPPAPVDAPDVEVNTNVNYSHGFYLTVHA